MDRSMSMLSTPTASAIRHSSALINSSMNNSMNASFSNSFSRRTSRYGGGNETVFLSAGSSLCLEPFGAQLPSMVRVALNNIEDEKKVSCRMDPNGWSWMVAKKKLYIWRHAIAEGKRTTIPCRELTLPPSEIVHHAKLVCVVGAAGSSTPACIAVSPEGAINYWPNIANESQTLSICADVPNGQECDSLSSIWPTGCILTTTSATVILVKPIGGNRPMLQCISLSLATKGWLGELHKKINYILPGGTSSETKRAKVFVPISKDNPSQPGAKQSTMYLLSGTSVQVWTITSDVQQCEIDCKNIDESMKRFFNEHVWDGRSDIRGIQVWLLDLLCFNSGRAALLVAALNQSESVQQDIHFGIVTFDPRNFKSRDTTKFNVVQYKTERPDSVEDALYSWKLLGMPNQNVFYMVSDEKILVISEDDPLDFIASESLGGVFLGSGHVTEATAVVFVSKVGLLSLRWNQCGDTKIPSLDDTFSEIRVPDHLSLSMTQHNIQDLFSSDDTVNRYKSAFLNFCGKRIDECEDILRNLFPHDVASLTPHDPIDKLTIALCEKLVDDAPVGDPRWLTNAGGRDDFDAIGMRSKMLIKNFLIDKKEGLELFFGFLHSTNILPRLTGVVVKDDVEATASILFNAYEKIGFAITLQYLQSEVNFRKLIDVAIKSIIMHRLEDSRTAQLSFNDLFYKDITNIHQFFTALVSIEESHLNEAAAENTPTIVLETTEVILKAFTELKKLHTLDKLGPVRKFLLNSLSERANSLTITPWYVHSSVLEQLSKQADIIVATSINTNEAVSKNALYAQLEELTDFILDGLKISLESLKGSERYTEKLAAFESRRTRLLGNLVQVDSLASVALAEKYLDFEVLVSVCYKKRDMERIGYLFDKYAQLDFATYTFEWYLRQRKSSELIETFSLGKHKNKLHQFLQAHPEVAWHHSIVNEDFRESSSILKRLADKEEASVDDKKFFLCMSKLGILATENIQPRDAELFKTVNHDLTLVEYQNQLPDDILEEYGLERSTMRTLTLTELIDLYSTNNIESNLKNFFQALELCDFLSSGNIRDDKRLQVVARAIRSDPWDTWATDHPEDMIETSLVFNLVSHAISKGDRLEELFDLARLTVQPTLKSLFENATANFLLHACFEHLATASMNMS